MKCMKCQAIIADDSTFCPKCGQKITCEVQRKCAKCQANIESDAVFCPKCGEKTTQEIGTSGKAETKTFDPLALKFAASRANATPNVQTPVTSVPTTKKESLPSASKPQKLWSELANGIRRTTYFSDDILELSEEEFGIALQRKLDANHVPSRVERTEIKWDDSGVTQRRLIIHPRGLREVPMCYSVGLNRIGNFTFIEERTYIKPPELPSKPEKYKDIPPSDMKAALIGLAIAVGGLLLVEMLPFLGIVMFVIGVIFVASAVLAKKQISEAKEHNAKVDCQVEAWINAWDSWEIKCLGAAYLANTDDAIGRIHQAFHDTIEQVSKELFASQAVAESKEVLPQSELRQAVAKRRSSYK